MEKQPLGLRSTWSWRNTLIHGHISQDLIWGFSVQFMLVSTLMPDDYFSVSCNELGQEQQDLK